MVRFILALIAIYLEESGVPMPVPSEVSIAYLGHVLRASPAALALGWIGLTVLIVLGSTNLFTLSRRVGPRLLHGRVGTALHLTPGRVERATRWFRRWGALAIVISRFVPGLRWAMAVTCGALGVPYRTFWLSTAAAAAVWAGLLLTIGLTIGDAIGRVSAAHPWLWLLVPIPAACAIAVSAIRLLSSAEAPSYIAVKVTDAK